MLGISTNYTQRVPTPFRVLFALLAMLGAFVATFFVAGLLGFKLLPGIEGLGTQGDFFGGHIAALIGCATLIVVVLTGYLQLRHDQGFRRKEYFLGGINAISNYDIARPGCEQALRLLDYFAAVALELNDSELLLILNTVMTKDIRKRIEEIEERGTEEYPNAVAARKRIQGLLESHYKELGRTAKANKVQPGAPGDGPRPAGSARP